MCVILFGGGGHIPSPLPHTHTILQATDFILTVMNSPPPPPNKRFYIVHTSLHVSCQIPFVFCYTIDVLQVMESILSRETTPKARPSSLARSQSSRQNRPPRAVHAHVEGRGSILGNGDCDQETGGVFSRARHTSLLSFDSIGGSFRAAPLMEQATAFESGVQNTQ